MPVFKKNKYYNQTQITFCNMPLICYGKNKQTKYVSLFQSFPEKELLDQILNIIDKNADFVFVERTAGIGEAYVLNFMIDELKTKFKFKNPVIVSHRKIYKDLFRIYHPDIPFYCTGHSLAEYNTALKRNCFKYKNKRFKVFHCTIEQSSELFRNYVKGYEVPYPEEIKKFAGVKNFSEKYPVFNEEDKSVVNLVRDLNIDKFIFINTEANGVKPVYWGFWFNICDKLKQKGYDIFVNTAKGVSVYGKSAQITITQALYLASLSKGIISIRCGLSEFLSPLKTAKHILYTGHNYHPVSAENMMKTSTLLNYPMVDKNTIHEYNTDLINEDKIIEQIVNSITKQQEVSC